MFAKPNIGWTKWEINGHKIGSVSYVDDVPFEFITACCNYLKNPVGFNLVLDGEGNDSGLTLLGNYFCAYSFNGSEPPYVTDLTPVSDFILTDSNDGPEFVEKLLAEAIEDFERDFDLWSEWNPGIYPEDKEIEAENLQDLIDMGKDILAKKPYQIPEIGNLLWGHAKNEYPVDRALTEDAFYSAFGELFDLYGYLEDKNYPETDRGGFENDVFAINPYYWGSDENIADIPNFIFKPEGITIEWYKYMFRDAYSNKALDPEKIKEMFRICRESMDK